MSVINCYTIVRLVKKKRLNNKEEIKKINITKALKAIKAIKI
jgi:hypothetical protein